MKNYGNLVAKYVAGNKSSKYPPILAKSLDEYNKKQLADLERFLKDDFLIVLDPYLCNPADHAKNLAIHKKAIQAEIARLKGQVKKVVKMESEVKKVVKKKKI